MKAEKSDFEYTGFDTRWHSELRRERKKKPDQSESNANTNI